MANATVTTTVCLGDKVEVHDTIVFLGVDQAFIGFLAGSCKAAVSRLMRESTRDSQGYTIHYQTVVSDDNGAELEKRPAVTCMGLSKAQVHGFLKFALDELSAINAMRYGDAGVHVA